MREFQRTREKDLIMRVLVSLGEQAPAVHTLRNKGYIRVTEQRFNVGCESTCKRQKSACHIAKCAAEGCIGDDRRIRVLISCLPHTCTTRLYHV